MATNEMVSAALSQWSNEQVLRAGVLDAVGGWLATDSAKLQRRWT